LKNLLAQFSGEISRDDPLNIGSINIGNVLVHILARFYG
jgi:hypothetical protein